MFPFLLSNTSRRKATNYTGAASMDSTAVASAVPGQKTTKPLATERVEPTVEAAPTLQQALVSGVLMIDKESFHSCSQK